MEKSFNKYLENDKSHIKLIDDTTVEGYAVLFDTVDLYGDTFTKDTYFGELDVLKPVLMYQHGKDETLKSAILGMASLSKDEIGIKFTAKIDPKGWASKQKKIADGYFEEYIAEIKSMINQGLLGISSGAVPATATWYNNIITDWVIGEISLTPNPAEKGLFGKVETKNIVTEKAGAVLRRELKSKVDDLFEIAKTLKTALDGTDYLEIQTKNTVEEIVTEKQKEIMYFIDKSKLHL